MHANIKLVSADINDGPVHAASALNHDNWPWQRPPKVNKSIFIAPGNPEYIYSEPIPPTQKLKILQILGTVKGIPFSCLLWSLTHV